MTTYRPQIKVTPVKTGRYRQLVRTAAARVDLPTGGERNPSWAECEELAGLADKVARLEAWRMSTATDLKAVLEVIQQAKVLMALSISGGLLSVDSLTLTVLSVIERNF